MQDHHPQGWHDKRREGLGGSDIGTLLGLNLKFTRPVDLWALKRRLIEPDPPSPAAARGTRLEPWIGAEAAERLRAQIAPGHEFLRHPRWPAVPIQANTDGTILAPGLPPGLFEAKTARRSQHPLSKSAEFARGQIPAAYLLQVQAYLACTGGRWGVIACAVGPAAHDDWALTEVELILLSFRAHPPLQRLIEEVCAEFWQHVETTTPPTWERHPRLSEALRLCDEAPVRPARDARGEVVPWV